MNLNKEVKDLYSEKYKTLMKEIENDTNKWKDIPCSWIEELMLKCPEYSVIYIYNVISIKIPMVFSTELEQIILTFVWSLKNPEKPKLF